LPQIQENAAKVQRKLDESLRDVLNRATQHGVGVFAAAEELLKRLSEHLQGWQFGKVPRGVVTSGAETL
jgi:transcription termination factor NusB